VRTPLEYVCVRILDHKRIRISLSPSLGIPCEKDDIVSPSCFVAQPILFCSFWLKGRGEWIRLRGRRTCARFLAAHRWVGRDVHGALQQRVFLHRGRICPRGKFYQMYVLCHPSCLLSSKAKTSTRATHNGPHLTQDCGSRFLRLDLIGYIICRWHGSSGAWKLTPLICRSLFCQQYTVCKSTFHHLCDCGIIAHHHNVS